jgi:hypothetical protein
MVLRHVAYQMIDISSIQCLFYESVLYLRSMKLNIPKAVRYDGQYRSIQSRLRSIDEYGLLQYQREIYLLLYLLDAVLHIV